MAKGGLGSGLGSLFEQNAADPASGVQSVRISEIEQNRSQPRKRFDDELIELLLQFKWWDRSIDEIECLMPILSCGDMAKVRKELKARL